MKILAIKLRRLGDTVLWTSALQALVDMGAEVGVVFPEYYRALFESDPRFKNRYPLGEKRGALVKEIRKVGYDFVLNFHASESTARFAKSLGGKECVAHFHHRTPKEQSKQRPIPNLGTPMKATERDLNLVRAIGWTGNSPKTQLFCDPAIREKVRGLIPKSDKPLILLGVSASRPAKEWPMEYYVHLSALLSSIATVGIVYENEKDLRGPYWKARLESRAHLIHTSSIEELMGVLTSAKFYVGSDSGVKHLAIALGLKTLTLFGPESIGEWHCYGDDQIALQVPVSCRDRDPNPKEFAWCGYHTCPLASHACMRLLTPEDVYKGVFASLVD